MATNFMNRKFKLITATIGAASVLAVPLIYTASCANNQIKNDQNSGEGTDEPTIDTSNPDNITDGSGNDDNFNSGDNNDQNFGNNDKYNTGSLSTDILAVSNQSTPKNTYSPTSTVTFKDYSTPQTVNGVYKYVHERGNLTNFNVNANVKVDVNDVMKTFNYFNYLKTYNSNNPNNTIANPNSASIFNDLKYLIVPIFNDNNKVFSASVSNEESDISYALPVDSSYSGLINGKITFNIKNVKATEQQIKLFNQSLTILPNTTHKLTFSFAKQRIALKSSQYNNRYFVAWYVPTTTLLFDDKQITTINNLTCNQNFFSKSFGVEFYNVSNNNNITVANNTNAKAFMQSLKPAVIQENIETTIFENTNKMLSILPNLKVILASLQKDPTVGEFIYDSAQPIANVLYEFNVVSKELSVVIAELLKTTYTGSQGVLDVIVNNKENLSSGLKKLLGDSLGENGQIVDMLVDMLKPDMSYDDVTNIKALAELFLPEGNLKTLFTKIIDVVIGSYDNNGKKVNSGNPYILDLVDFVINDMFEEFYEMFIKDNLNVDKSVIDVFINIYKVLSDRTKDANNNTVVKNNRVDFKTHIVTKLFSGTGQNAKEGSWWLIDSMITVLKAFGIDIEKNQSNLFYELITQAYTLDWNKDNVNYSNFMSALNEVKAWVTFLADGRNYTISGDFVKFSDGSKVKYDNQTYSYDFNYKVKFTFNRYFSFDLQLILDLLPTDLFLEAFKLVNQEWIHTKVLGIEVGIYTKYRYAWASLDRLIYRMIPRKVIFEKGDAFNMDYSAETKKLFYAQNKDEDGNTYNGFNSILGVSTYFTQADPNKGVISSTMASAFLASDYQNLKNSYPLDKVPGYGKTGVIIDVLTEDKADHKQSAQNITAVQEFVQKLLVNKMTFNINLIGKDKNSKVESPADNDVYLNGKTFKWNDNDLNYELIKADTNPQWSGKKFTEYNNMFKYKNVDNVSYKYNYINSTKGTTASGTFNRQVAYFEESAINTLKNDLFTLGSNVSASDTMVSIKPITNLNIKKIIDISGGGVLNLGFPVSIYDIIKLNINLELNFMAFQVTVMTNTPLLDLSNVSRSNNSFTLSNYKYSNVFDKVFFVPRVKVAIPTF